MAEMKSMKMTTLETIVPIVGIDSLSWTLEYPFASLWLDRLLDVDPARSIDVVVFGVGVAIVERPCALAICGVLPEWR